MFRALFNFVFEAHSDLNSLFEVVIKTDTGISKKYCGSSDVESLLDSQKVLSVCLYMAFNPEIYSISAFLSRKDEDIQLTGFRKGIVLEGQ